MMGFVGYRRSNRLKSLDLRLELRKAVNILHGSLSGLTKLMQQADRSRSDLTAMRGNTGALAQWKQDLEVDRTAMAKLCESAPQVSRDFHELSVEELESTLVQVHRLQGNVVDLKRKYEASLQTDDEQRKYMRDMNDQFLKKLKA
jgi:hypothetical protein